jgi:hypothetical protein
MKIIFGVATALLLSVAAFSQPAHAACWWNGYGWQCWQSQPQWWGLHHYRDRDFHRDRDFDRPHHDDRD